MAIKPQAILDIECYINYFLVKFRRLSDGQTIYFEHPLDEETIRKILRKYEIVTFNGWKYDIPMLRLAMSGASLITLKEMSDRIIQYNMSPYQLEQEYNLIKLPLDHIDLIEVAPSKTSLKGYGGRMHCPKLQDLPYDPQSTLTDEQKVNTRIYCGNDLEITHMLLEKLKPQLDLRRTMSVEYHCDLRSRSDAQIAETVITSELQRLTGIRPSKGIICEGSFFYQPPSFLEGFSHPVMDTLRTCSFIISQTGFVQMPDELSKTKIRLNGSTYQMGIGGLHSSESAASYEADDRWLLVDWDVASYYPAIILNCGLYPESLGPEFLEIFRKIVDERLEAKHSGDKVKAQSLKITVNGTFGKLGSPYSAIYAPELMIQVTVTGQLALLMLIFTLEERGVPVISANTDGIVLRCPRGREEAMIRTIHEWEKITGFNMERTDYTSIHSRDVNNYLAITTNGKVKTKGLFSPAGLRKNPQNEICSDAVKNFLKDGVPLEKTIRGCTDITKFLTLRKVNGGAIKNGEYIGKIIRWYYGTEERGSIHYQNSGNTVPRTKGAVPLMELRDFPSDVDFDWYLREAEDMMAAVGRPVRGQMNLDF